MEEIKTDVPKKQGGYRPGSGRPVVPYRQRAITKSVTLSGQFWERLAAQGKGTPSQIIKKLIAASEAGA